MSSTHDSSITVDPSAPGTVIRWALGIEAGMNVIFGAFALYAPSTFLSYLVSDPSNITPVAETMVQIQGVIVQSLNIPMVLAIPQTRQGFELRKPAYYLFGFSEVLLISLFSWLAWSKSEKELGIPPKNLMWAAQQVTPPLLWRIFTLTVKPHWFGRYRDAAKRS